MLKAIIGKLLDREEPKLGGSLDYMRYILKHDFAAFRRMLKFTGVANVQRHAPVDVFHLARIAAAQSEDCGACVRIELSMARKDGVDEAFLEAAVLGEINALPQDLAAAWRFGDAVARGTYEESAERDFLKERYGDRVLIELAMGVAMARVYPAIKRGLGYASECGRPEELLKP